MTLGKLGERGRGKEHKLIKRAAETKIPLN